MKRLLIFLVFVVIASLGTVMADDPQGGKHNRTKSKV